MNLNPVLEMSEAARLPDPGDNVAIATRRLEKGTRIAWHQLVFELSHTLLEGHRFAVHHIRRGDDLLSWGLPFGRALRPIETGEYVSNEKMLAALKGRHVTLDLPETPNFADARGEYLLTAATFKPGVQVRSDDRTRTFAGFHRCGARGVGTRNYLLVLGTSSRTGALVRLAAEQFRGIRSANFDGVVAVEHTEGGNSRSPNNRELTLRTLAGFMVNANVGAVIAVDAGDESVSNAALRAWLSEKKYPLEHVPHEFVSVAGSFQDGVQRVVKEVRRFLDLVNETHRQSAELAELKLGLQCGGSDAFSGISANPLLGLMSREIVARSGSANLAETSELIGAERYVLANVRDFETASRFLAVQKRFEEWAAMHGHSAEGNPSGGNMYRGLYNITIKSIGAARKKDPGTRLDYVIDFAERMVPPGFYFMDSPGNDLESIAGQVAAGCNLILFATGNGSITNFPFAPTIKVMTTSGRFELVRGEMDINAGRYLDGETMENLGREAVEYMIEVASGRHSAGENAGHSQVQLWREWRNGRDPGISQETPRSAARRPIRFGPSREKVALVLPTSLCAGEVAKMIARKLNENVLPGITRAAALPHTEGCGNSGGESEALFMRTMAGYLVHPLVGRALLLEHGCEKTHNDAFRNLLARWCIPESRFGWASIQMDGGIDRVVQKAASWFEGSADISGPVDIAIGFYLGSAPSSVADGFKLCAGRLASDDKAVVWAGSVQDAAFETLRYGEKVACGGSSRMETPTDDLVEIISGLGATGVRVIVAFDDERPVAGNPVVPVVQVSTEKGRVHPGDVDLVLRIDESPESIASRVDRLIQDVESGRIVPKAMRCGNIAFQVTRGLTGVSL